MKNIIRISDINKKAVEYIFTAFLGALLLFLVWVYSDANVNHFTAMMDSDIASNTLFGPLLYENGFSKPDTWIGSTGDSIISAPNLAALLYFVTGRNMNLSMGLACTVLTIVMTVLLVMYYRQLDLTAAQLVSGIIISYTLMRTSDEIQSVIFLYAAYYVSDIITLLFVLLCYNKVVKNDKVPVWIFVPTVILSILNGLEGMHACLFCYMPVLGVEIVRRIAAYFKKEKQGNLLIIVWLLVISFFALFVTNFTDSYNLGASRNIRHAGEKFVEIVWPFFLEVISFEKMPVLVALFCVFAAIGYFFVAKELVFGEKEKSLLSGDWSAFAFLLSVIICILSSTFTTAEAAPRYYVMILFTVGTGTALFMRKFGKKCTALVAVLVLIYGLGKTMLFYDDLIADDVSDSQPAAQVVNWMEERGYEYGYSTFDHANLITVVSNDRVKIRAVNSMEEMQGAKWLTDKTWYPPYKNAEGATCYVLSKALAEDFDKFLARENPAVTEIGEVEDYTIYVLDRDYTVWVD